MFWALGLWLSVSDRRSFGLTEELADGPDGPPAVLLDRAPLSRRATRGTLGLLGSRGLAMLTADREPREPGEFGLEVAGFGPQGAALAADLVTHVQAWDAAGQRNAAGLAIEAYPRSAPDQPGEAAGAVLIERPGTRFLVRHT